MKCADANSIIYAKLGNLQVGVQATKLEYLAWIGDTALWLLQDENSTFLESILQNYTFPFSTPDTLSPEIENQSESNDSTL